MPEHSHSRADDTDYITRSALELHCAHIHGPLVESVKETKGWLDKLDKRMWGLLFGMLLAILTGAINIYVGWTTKSAVATESRRSIRYEKGVSNHIAGSEE